MDDLKERLRALYRFLSGEGALDDLWFGDEPPPGHKRRGTYWWRSSHLRAVDEAADRIEALEAENERLRGVLEAIEDGTYPRPLGKSWRMDLSSSKHDRCIHDAWMYETCEECLDAFVRAALGEKQ